MPRKLEVRYVPLPPVKEYDKNKLLIKDIPKDLEEELLSMFIEKHLGLDEEDFTIDLRSGVAILLLESSYTDEGNVYVHLFTNLFLHDNRAK